MTTHLRAPGAAALPRPDRPRAVGRTHSPTVGTRPKSARAALDRQSEDEEAGREAPPAERVMQEID